MACRSPPSRRPAARAPRTAPRPGPRRGPDLAGRVAASLPMFMATLDNLVMTSALPVIRADLGSSVDSWRGS